jgi:cation diffusion facilitator CzcD-associated flavoprotein CzcO
MTRDLKALIVGAGPGGLAAAAALGSAGVPATILERASSVGSSWRGHYDRLHLHTARFLSGLPGMPIPRSAGSWVSRDDFVAYLDAYALRHALDVRTGTDVSRIDRGDRGWRIATSAGEFDATHVVVATGYNRLPLLPEWPGRDAFAGTLLHSSRYRSGAEFRAKDVLVVGAGNSGAEIAVDLVEQGASRVRLSIRRPPNIVLRMVAGFVPSQLVSILLSKLPLPFADAIARATARLTIGDLRKLGLPAPDRGIYTEMIRDRQIPIIDVGLVAALRAGRVEVVPAVEGFDGPSVRLLGGASIRPDVVVAATGYRPSLEPLVRHLGVLDEHGLPCAHGEKQAPGAPGLHFLGFSNPPTGNLREMSIDARRIARRVAQG